jgi:hypothetical protein
MVCAYGHRHGERYALLYFAAQDRQPPAAYRSTIQGS